MVTIFTPTYNRAHLLVKLYESLKKQTSKNFEWLVVDDGSTDGTSQLFEELLKQESDFQVRYLKKENGGKHTAINLGVQEAKGEMFLILDSDDWLSDNAVEIINNDSQLLPKENFAGLGYNKSYADGKMIGQCHKEAFIDATSLDRSKIGLQGDKAEVFFTDCLRKYPFPVFEGEKFMTEAIVWNRMAIDNLKIRWYNKSFYYCEYQPMGLSMSRPELKSFKGYTLFVKEFLHYKSSTFKEKTKILGVFVENAHVKKIKNSELAKTLDVSLFFILVSNTIYKLVKMVKKNRAKRLNIIE